MQLNNFHTENGTGPLGNGGGLSPPPPYDLYALCVVWNRKAKIGDKGMLKEFVAFHNGYSFFGDNKLKKLTNMSNRGSFKYHTLYTGPDSLIFTEENKKGK